MTFLKTTKHGDTETISLNQAADLLEEETRRLLAEEDGVDLTHEDYKYPDMGIYVDTLTALEDYDGPFEAKDFTITKQ